MDQVRIGIIGIGNMGTSHSKNITEGKIPGMVLAAVADRRPARLEWAKENLPADVLRFSEGADLIKSGCCDAVLVAVPHYQHVELGILAMQHGLHVMLEKPVAVYTLAAREMMAEADKHPELTFGMMFNQRTNCVYRKLKQMIDGGELGQIKRVNWIITDWYRTQYYYNSGDWRASWEGEGGGVLLNQCPHQLDLIQWLCGMPSRVRAFCHNGKWHDIEVEDDVTAYLEYPGGATGVFVTTTGDAPGTNRLEITGTLGSVICEKDTLTFHRLKTDEREWCQSAASGFERPPMETITVETDGENLQHVGVLRAFTGHILRGEPLVADGREGIRGLTLSNAMHLSSWLDKTVDLPFDEELFLSELNKRRATSRLRKANDAVLDTSGSY